jgi:plastocyanin domain-containing protein
MDVAQVTVTLLGAGLSVLIAWYFWFSEKKGVRAEAAGGVQEARIVVKGGYDRCQGGKTGPPDLRATGDGSLL